MKKIIGGKKYDTSTAKELAIASHGYKSDFAYYEETLYQKKTGEFFLYGEGGPASKYAVSEGNNDWSGGCEITPVTFDAARNWAEKNLSVDDYERIFGDVAEDDSRSAINLSMSTASIERLRRAASEKGVTVSVYVEKLIDEATR